MTERSERSGTDQQAGSADGRHTGDETTSVFVADGKHEQPEHETTTHLERPNVPLGSPAPPWQRAQPPGGSGGPGGPGGSPGSTDHPTVAEQRPSYAPPNGAPVQNPFLAPKDHHAGSPPPVPSDQPIPLGGPGAIPVGGPGGHGGHGGHPGVHPGQQRPPGAGRPTARPAMPMRGRGSRAPRKASLQVRRFDPWSVLKLSLVLTVAMFLMWLVAVGVLYGVLDGMGVWDKLNGAYSDLASVNDETGGTEPLISAGRVFGVSAVVGVVNIILFTAFATVAAFVYNVSADLAGGIEVTLSERD